MRAILELLMRAIEELRDPWALAFAAASAYLAYLFGGYDWQIVGVAVAVLAVRVAAGLLLPLAPLPPAPHLTSEEYVIARLIARGLTNTEIADQLKTTTRAIDRLEARIGAKIGGGRDDIARHVGTSTPEPQPRHWYERTVFRGTLAGAGLISLMWTLYNISIRILAR